MFESTSDGLDTTNTCRLGLGRSAMSNLRPVGRLGLQLRIVVTPYNSPCALSMPLTSQGGADRAVRHLPFGALPSPGLAGKTLAETLEMASLPTISALFLLLALFWFRPRCVDAAP